MVAGKYRVERVLGHGGMGVVVAARHLALERQVALKFLAASASDEAKRRFAREARAAARVQGEHVARVLDVGALEGGQPFIVMEYLAGHDLAVELATRGALPIEEAVAHVLAACEALAEVHAAGIVHRDLKPSNLFLTRHVDGSPRIKLLDFGISKLEGDEAAATLTREGAALGSPRYMAPEQLRASEDVDARCDVWALGAILYELIAGEPAFSGESMAELRARIEHEPPPSLQLVRGEVPADLEAVILKCFDKDPARRYPNVAELAAELVRFASPEAQAHAERAARIAEAAGRDEDAPASTTLTSTQVTREEDESAGASVAAPGASKTPPRRGRPALAALAAVVALAGALGVAALWSRSAARIAAPSTPPEREAPASSAETKRDDAAQSDAIEEARRAHARGEQARAKEILERLIAGLLDEGVTPGSARARVGAEAQLLLSDLMAPLDPLPRPASRHDWYSQIDALQKQLFERVQRYGMVIQWQHPDLAQCAVVRQARLYEEATQRILTLEVPRFVPSIDEAWDTREEVVRRGYREAARTHLVLAESAAKTAAVRPVPAGSRCRDEALATLTRVRDRLAELPDAEP